MLNQPLNKLTFTVVDTETTGLSIKKDRIIEIAAIRINPDLLIDKNNTFSQLINPQCHIHDHSYKVHGINDAMVANKPLIADIIPEFAEFMKNTILVFHNAKFDMSFIKPAFEVANINPTFLNVLDTIAIAKKAFPKLKKYNLDNITKTLNISADAQEGYHRHRALFDATLTAQLLVLCIKNLERMGIKYIHEL